MARRRQLYEGKAKILYEGPEQGTLVAYFKDDATAFDGQKHEVLDGKGVLNNRISEHIMTLLTQIGIPNHFIRRLNMREQLIREVEISTNLLPPRFFLDRNHLDLQDALSAFRATRPFGLAAWTEAIGASSPKEGSVAGAEVGEAFHAGRTGEIAEYCARDVVATARLADQVLRYWRPFIFH